MASKFELQVGVFRGPLDKLLEFIEERRLEINQVSLAQVTHDFLAYLKALQKEKKEEAEWTRLIADFIVVASRLILIKSKSLIPELSLTREEETEIKDLEGRLTLYREFKKGFKLILAQYESDAAMFSRPYFLHISGIGSAFYPGGNLNSQTVMGALTKLSEALQAFVHEEGKIREKMISIEEKIQEIIERLTKEQETSFHSMTQKKPREEMIIIFLALLHLAREQLISLEQEAHFSDIMVRKL